LAGRSYFVTIRLFWLYFADLQNESLGIEALQICVKVGATGTLTTNFRSMYRIIEVFSLFTQNVLFVQWVHYVLLKTNWFLSTYTS
jgi:hypothetical protein